MNKLEIGEYTTSTLQRFSDDAVLRHQDRIIKLIADKKGEDNVGEETVEMQIWNDMMDLWAKLEKVKPTERNEQARRYAVTITEFQKVMGYFYTFVLQECSLEFRRQDEQKDS